MEMKTDNIYIKLHSALRNVHPSHADRLWLAGYLLWYHNNDVKKVCSVIHKVNNWEDYNRSVTRKQVESVMKTKRSGTRLNDCFPLHIAQGQPLELTSKEVDKLAEEFDWSAAQKKAFDVTERMRQCLTKDCYLEPDCIRRPCWVRPPVVG